VKPKISSRLMLGNEAIAAGLLENGCTVATAYPGTPSSEILTAVAALNRAHQLDMHSQWAVNEKVAFEIAFTSAISGLRSAVAMKQVGLNVASDPLMSAAYMGVKGGFVIISADDPGPHSSQTEQDSRLMAMMAKIPVLDPATPDQAREMTATAFALSEAFEIPVMLRPTTRVCHCRQDVPITPLTPAARTPEFTKNPGRWAATPKFRFQLHQQLEDKLARMAAHGPTAPRQLNPQAKAKQAVIASGVAAAHAHELLRDLGLWPTLPLYQVDQPFPLHTDFIEHVRTHFDQVLVIEETTGVIEMQLADYKRVRGKQDGFVSRVGELQPHAIENLLRRFAGLPAAAQLAAPGPGRRPTLCAGCPHRASFFAIKKAAPKAIYTSDIGCYTLGLNLGAVDTVLCMGAAISQAAGFYQAHRHLEKRPDIIATIGDSTFFHAGLPPLIDAVVQNVRMVLVILDNRTTAMTGNQPTAASGIDACGQPANTVDIEALVRGCGIESVTIGDPYDLKAFTVLVKQAVAFSRQTGPAVVIARHPCLLDRRQRASLPAAQSIEVSDACDGCQYCVQHFECPALIYDECAEQVHVDALLCCGCGVCLTVCPKKAIIGVDADRAPST
jgi:indolepyruvate ferredoxin oxidoreductase alpha subunit